MTITFCSKPGCGFPDGEPCIGCGAVIPKAMKPLIATSDIQRMVDRFLSWPLPDSVCSDQCACESGYQNRSGTNLLTAAEARQMIEHVLAPDLSNAAGELRLPDSDDRKETK